MNWVLLGIGIILLLLGALIKYGGQYWLIAGYNTASPEKRAIIDIRRLSGFMGNCLFVMGVLLLLTALLSYYGYAHVAFPALVIGVFGVTAFLLFRSQTYAQPRTQQKRLPRGLKAVLIISGAFTAMIGGIILYGMRPPQVEVNNRFIVIGGLYSTKIPLQSIEQLELHKEMPRVLLRTNGLGAGGILKGNFKLEELGQGKLYVYQNKPPFLFLSTKEGYVFVNFKDSAKTIALYQQIQNNLADK